MKKRIFLTLTLCGVFFACTKDDSPETTNPDSVGGTNPPVGELSIDAQLLSQIKKASDVLSNDQIWPGYELDQYPLYLVHVDSNGDPDKGFVVNPQTEIEGATKLQDDENGGLNAYRYDLEAENAFKVINGEEGNGLYDFNFIIDLKGYYIQTYTDEQVKAGEELSEVPGGFFDPSKVLLSSIDFIVHENFHTYQEDWTFFGSSTPKNLAFLSTKTDQTLPKKSDIFAPTKV